MNKITFYNKLSSLILIVSIAMVAVFVVNGKPLAASSIIALVNDEPISNYDLEQRVRFQLAIGNMRNSKANRKNVRKKALDSLINELIILQEAKKYNMVATDDAVSQIISSIAKGNKASVKQLLQFTGKYGAKSATWKQQIRAKQSWNILVSRVFKKDLNIDEGYLDRRVIQSKKAVSGDTIYSFREISLILKNKQEKKKRVLEMEVLRKTSKTCTEAIKHSKKLPRAKISQLLEGKASKIKDKKFIKLLNDTPVNRISKNNIYKDKIVAYAICNKKVVSSQESKRENIMQQLQNKELNLQADRQLKDLRRDAVIVYK